MSAGLEMPIDDDALTIRRIFDPLAARLGLGGAIFKRENTYFTITYFGDVVGLDILVEYSDFVVFAAIFQPPGNGKMPNLLPDANGEVHMMYLQGALDRLGIPCQEDKAALMRLGGDYHNCEAMASRLATMVQRTWATIEENIDKLMSAST